MAAEAELRVEVVYARAEEQVLIELAVPAGSSVRHAIECSGLLRRYPELAAGSMPVGIHGRVVDEEAVLSAGDRVEIYRPLAADPKQARRRRAAGTS